MEQRSNSLGNEGNPVEPVKLYSVDAWHETSDGTQSEEVPRNLRVPNTPPPRSAGQNNIKDAPSRQPVPAPSSTGGWEQFYSPQIQLSRSQITEIMNTISETTRFLVFGVGYDSKMWANGGNVNGKTMFMEHDRSWMSKVQGDYPELDIRFIDYDCNMRDAFRVYMGNEIKLMESFPDYLVGTKWDTILVDAPTGGGGADNPGRMKSIYWASQLVTPEGHVFVHDIPRDIENQFSQKYLTDALGRPRKTIGDLAHFPPGSGRIDTSTQTVLVPAPVSAPIPAPVSAPSNGKPIIAICVCTHSSDKWTSLADTALQTVLIPSIERTITPAEQSAWDIRIYLGIDHDDSFWKVHHESFTQANWITIHRGFFNTPKSHIPFNENTRQAFDDGAEYIARINDDSEFKTRGWITLAVAKLRSYKPTNVGVVGPLCRQGNQAIITHDFVHRTHLYIFEYYYPAVFDNWYIDDWITHVYRPGRYERMRNWEVIHHTGKHGTRYAVNWDSKKLLQSELEKGKKRIQEWLSNPRYTPALPSAGQNVIKDVPSRHPVPAPSSTGGWEQFYSPQIQLSRSQITEIMNTISETTRFLVFGVGYDSKMWANGGNVNGKTMFMEHDRSWMSKVQGDYPELDIRFIDYDCNMRDAFRVYMGNEIKLMESFPDYLVGTKWDTILVDAPTGGGGADNPGRMKSIYWASQLVTPEGHVFVHDIPRDIENQFSQKYLTDALGRPRKTIGDLAHFPPGSGRIDTSLQTVPLTRVVADRGKSRHLVVAAAMGYWYDIFRRFVVPLRRVYGGDVVIFTDDKTLQDSSIGALCRKYDVVLKKLQSSGHHLGVKRDRYTAYAKECEGHEYCFATDFRDVFFQDDPFKSIPSGYDLILAEEYKNVKIRTCPYNSDWIRTCWGDTFLNKIGDNSPICSGTIMGTPAGMEALRVAMLAEMEKSNKKRDCSARDQGHLNYLYFADKLHVPTLVEPRGTGIVNTVGYITPRSTITRYLNADGLAKNEDGSISAVVHQYDRFPQLSATLKRLYDESTFVYVPKGGAIASNAAIAPTSKKSEKFVISYSFYGGSNARYTDGAVANAKLVKTVYPGWIMRVYHDSSVPSSILQRMRDDGVELIDMTGSSLNKMSWRFLAASDPTVSRYCCRDIDSRLSNREKAAVYEWIESGKKFHVLRDHPSHSNYAMSGGMWCGTHDAVPDMKERLEARQLGHQYLQDMNFLNSVIWPIAQKSLLQHDSFSCDRFGGGLSYPTKRVGLEHVGSVYIGGKMRKVDTDILARAGENPKCTRHLQKVPDRVQGPDREDEDTKQELLDTSTSKLPLCLGILAYQGVQTLENTLKSYARVRVFDMIAETYILFQKLDSDERRAWAEDVVERYPSLKPIYQTDNTGWKAFITLNDACRETETTLILEEDFEIASGVSADTVREQLSNAVWLLRNGVDSVRMRSRKNPGSPNWSQRTWDATHTIESTHLISHVFWDDYAEEHVPEIYVCRTRPKTWCAPSANAHYTNNPTVYRNNFARDLYALVPSGADWEPWLTKHWSKQKYTVAYPDALFTHKRLDRTLGTKVVTARVQGQKEQSCSAAMRLPTFTASMEPSVSMTFIVLNWSRRSKVVALIREALRHPNIITEIILWNHDPQAFPTSVLPTSDKIRVVNSPNIMDRGKYAACASAKNSICVYSDDDWNIFPYLPSLALAYSQNPHFVHTTTEKYTWYTNMIEWVYDASERGIHSRFGWIGCGSIIPRIWAERHLRILDACVPSGDHVLADVLFIGLTNQYQIQTEVEIIAAVPASGVRDNRPSSAIGLHPKQRPLQLQMGPYLEKVAKATDGEVMTQSDCVARTVCRSPQICVLCTNFLPATPRQGFAPSDPKQQALRTRDNLPSGSLPFMKHPYSHALDGKDDTFWSATNLQQNHQWGLIVEDASSVEITCAAQGHSVDWRIIVDGRLLHDKKNLCPKSTFDDVTKRVTFEYAGSSGATIDIHAIRFGPVTSSTKPRQSAVEVSSRSDYITNKRYITFCDVAFMTRSRNDLKLPLPPNAVVCAMGTGGVLSKLFKLDIKTPFTLITLENDEAVPQDVRWLKHKYLKRWYGWNSNHPDVLPIPIGLNEDSQLGPMTRAKKAATKVEKLLVNFKQDRTERINLYRRIQNEPYVHVETYSKKWTNANSLTAHYERLSQFKWTLCPRGAGEDTHRLWEALYLGSIPVVLKSRLSSLYEGLPVIQLNSWNELSLDTLRRASESLPHDRTNAYFEHWAQAI
eukprot:g1.t1